MILTKTDRGFEWLEHGEYPDCKKSSRIFSQSSAIGDYEDSFDKPGSSYLWLGESHHLNREEVTLLIKHLTHWVETGSLSLPEPPKEEEK